MFAYASVLLYCSAYSRPLNVAQRVMNYVPIADGFLPQMMNPTHRMVVYTRMMVKFQPVDTEFHPGSDEFHVDDDVSTRLVRNFPERSISSIPQEA